MPRPIFSVAMQEPEFFSKQCSKQAQCSAAAQRTYIWDTLRLQDAVDSKLHKAAFEASTHYAAVSTLCCWPI